MLGSFATKAIAMRKISPWGQERQRDSCVTITYHLSPSMHLTINKHGGKTIKLYFPYLFLPLFFHSSLPTNLPMFYRAPPEKYKITFSPHPQWNSVSIYVSTC